MKMNLYKVTANVEGYSLTAVVACERIQQAAELAGWDEEMEESVWIGDSIFTTPQVVCQESL